MARYRAIIIGTVMDSVKKNKVLGYNLLVLDIEQKHFKVMPVLTSAVIKYALNTKDFEFDNAEVVNGKLVGTNGALTTYGKLVMDNTGALRVIEDKLVIINKLLYNDYTVLGYFCSNALGDKTQTISAEDVLRYASAKKVSNAYVVVHNGKPHLRATKGEFKAVVANTNTQAEFRQKMKSSSAQNPAQSKSVSTQQAQPVNHGVSTQKPQQAPVQQAPVQAPAPAPAPVQQAPVQAPAPVQQAPVQQAPVQEQKAKPSRPGVRQPILDNIEDHFSKFERKPEDIGKATNYICNQLLKFKTVPKIQTHIALSILSTLRRYKRPCSSKQFYRLNETLAEWLADSTLELKDNTDIYPISATTLDEDKSANPLKQGAKKVISPAPIQAKEAVENPVETKKKEEVVAEEKPKPQEQEVDTRAHVTFSRKVNFVPPAPPTFKTSDGIEYAYSILRETGKPDRITITGLVKGNDAYKYMSNIHLQIPETMDINGQTLKVTSIGKSAFQGLTADSVTLSSNIEEVFESAFARSTIKFFDCTKSKITFISSRCFYGCSKLERVEFNDRITKIHSYAFGDCSKLKFIVLPDTVEDLGTRAFANCYRLETFKSKVNTVQSNAFNNCISLKNFDFSSLRSIGSSAFSGCGFESLAIGEPLRSIEKRAFANCPFLEDIKIEEVSKEFIDSTTGETSGNRVVYIGEQCFYKTESSCDEVLRLYKEVYGVPGKYVDIASVDTPKVTFYSMNTSIFGEVKLVKGFVGTPVETYCFNYNIPFVAKDKLDASNASRVRIMSSAFSIDSTDKVVSVIQKNLTTLDNSMIIPTLNTKKIKNIELSAELQDLWKLTPVAEDTKVEPSAKFIATINFLQDVSDFTNAPFTQKVIALKPTFNVMIIPQYTDGYNSIYFVTYFKVDTLDKATFILVRMGNSVVYCTYLTPITNILITNTEYKNQLPMSKTSLADDLIRNGDRIGVCATISGISLSKVLFQEPYVDPNNPNNSGPVTPANQVMPIKLGEKLRLALCDAAIGIRTSRYNIAYYIPTYNRFMVINDARKWINREENKLAKDSEDCVSVFGMSKLPGDGYEQFLEEVNKAKLAGSADLKNNDKFFESMNQMSSRQIANMVKSIEYIDDSKVGYLYEIAQRFYAEATANGKDSTTVSADDMSETTFGKLIQSFLFINKGVNWLKTSRKKTLNTDKSYHIGKYTILEYVSNSVVKFERNPYMCGGKNSLTFEIKDSHGKTISALASKHTLASIAEMLYCMAEKPYGWDDWSQAPVLMQDPEHLDVVPSGLFYDFYPILCTNGESSSDGWSITEYYTKINERNKRQGKYGETKYSPYTVRDIAYRHAVNFYISMYKPTGVFYLVIKAYTSEGQNARSSVVGDTYKNAIVVFPIGSLARALTVANTTTSNVEELDLFSEMCDLYLQELTATSLEELYAKFPTEESRDYRVKNQIAKYSKISRDVLDKYIEARKMSLAGEHRTSEYRKYICDRAAFMIGTVNTSGKLEVEASDLSYVSGYSVGKDEISVADEIDGNDFFVDDAQQEYEPDQDMEDAVAEFNIDSEDDSDDSEDTDATESSASTEDDGDDSFSDLDFGELFGDDDDTMYGLDDDE